MWVHMWLVRFSTIAANYSTISFSLFFFSLLNRKEERKEKKKKV